MHQLGLTTGLGVVAGAEDSAGAQQTPNILPERCHEPQVAVMDDVVRCPKQGNTFAKNNLATYLPESSPSPNLQGIKHV